MKHKISSLFLFLFLSLCVSGAPISKGKLKKALENITKYNFGKAYSILENYSNDSSLETQYALSMLYKYTSTPFSNIDTAYTLVISAITKYNAIKDKKKQHYYANLGIDSASLYSTKIEIETAAYEDVLKEKTLSAYNYFISKYYSSNKIKEIINLRNKILFDIAIAAGTSQALTEFIEKNPGFEDIELAKKLKEDLEFYEETYSGDINSYFYFIKTHPENSNINKAIENLFSKLKQTPNLNHLEDFIVTISHQSPYYDSAWKELYDGYTFDSRTETFIDFKYLYLGFPFQKRLEKDIENSKKTFFPIKENNRWGFITSDTTLKIATKYEWVGGFVNNVFPGKTDNEIEFLNKSGRLLFSRSYENVEKYSDDLFLVTQGERVGLIDHIGNNILPIDYEELYPMSSKMTGFCLEEKCGFLDSCFNEKIPPVYDFVGQFIGELATVYSGDFIGVVNKKGDTILPVDYQWVEILNYGFIKAKNDFLYELYKYTGDTLLSIGENFNFIEDFNDELAFVGREGKFGYINKHGNIKIPLKFSFKPSNLKRKGYDYNFHESYAKAYLKKGYGIIDTAQNIVVSFKYKDAMICSEGIVGLKEGTKWSYYNIEKKEKLPGAYSTIKPFKKGYGVVKEGKIVQIVDTTGAVVLEEIWDNVQVCGNNSFIVSKYGKYGIINTTARYILPLIYDSISFYSEDILFVKASETIGYYSLSKESFIYKGETGN